MKLAFILPLLLMACAKPNPVTDSQVQVVAEHCQAYGKKLQIFNSPLASRAYCE
jgi:hypothetical protein